MQNNIAALQPDAMYHIYNRANGSELLFVSDENYRYFLRQFRKYIEPVAETFCFCLMPNHFHFLVRMRGEEEIKAHPTGFENLSGVLGGQGFENLSGVLSRQFSNFFNSYSKAFNKQQNRRGSLFMRPYKRIRIEDERYLRNLIVYIHQNPVKAGLAQHPQGWQFSSFKDIVNDKRGFIRRNEVIELFYDLENFLFLHTRKAITEDDLQCKPQRFLKAFRFT